MSVDPQDGAVVALTGGFDFFLSNYNRAVQARRQPGSAFKPFVYSAALDNGFNAASIINDAPPDIGYDPVLERVWRPENFGGRYYGLVRLRNALAESMNAASIRVMQQVGVGQTVDHVRRFGFDDVAVPENLSLALGAGGVAPLDLVSGFATFANGGYRIEKYFVERVETASGEVLYEAMPAFVCKDEDLRAAPPTQFTDSLGAAVSRCGEKPATTRASGVAQPELVTDVTDLYAPMRVAPTAISPQNAHLITDMLQDVIRHGTGARAQRELARSDLAGKTGTTNDGRDTWFVGFSRDFVAAAWVGFDQDRPLGGREQGGITAIPMWIGFMAEALDGVPEQPFRTPPGIVEVRINPESGLVASDANPHAIFEKFDIDNIPEREPDPVFSVTLDPLRPGEQPAPDRAIFAERLQRAREEAPCPHAALDPPSRAPAALREQLAQEAARLMIEGGIEDFGLAKRKAAERFGVRSAGALPSNGEIQASLAERQRIFEPATHDQRLSELRRAAAQIMEYLAPFQPRLVGSVLAGTPTVNAPIELHVFSDSPELVAAVAREVRLHAAGTPSAASASAGKKPPKCRVSPSRTTAGSSRS